MKKTYGNGTLRPGLRWSWGTRPRLASSWTRSKKRMGHSPVWMSSARPSQHGKLRKPQARSATGRCRVLVPGRDIHRA